MKKLVLLFVTIFAVFGLSACDLLNNEDVLSCIEDPTGPDCDPNQVLANTVIQEWDGSMEHIQVVMDNMDMATSMKQTMTVSFIIEDEYQSVNMQMVTVDQFVEVDGKMLLSRNVTQSIDNGYEVIEFTTQVVYEEVDTGVHVYIYAKPLKDMIVEQSYDNEGQEIVDAMNTLGLGEDWIVIKLDDSLANVIEIEVLKDLLVDVFYKEIGISFFYDLQEEAELETGFDFGLYGVDLGLFVDYVLNEQFEEAELLVQNIDVEGMLAALDVEVLNQVAIDNLNWDAGVITAQLPGFVIADEIAFLEANGFFAWYDGLTETELDVLRNEYVIDEGLELFAHYNSGDLAHFLVMLLLDESDLYSMPGLDYDQLVVNLDNLDYDALALEQVDLALLLEAMYNGEEAFNVFVSDLQATAPESAKILAPFAGTMVYLEDARNLLDDIVLGFENLEMFTEYFTLQYYQQNGMAALDIEVTENNEVKTSVTFNNYDVVVLDVLEDVYAYLDSFQSFEMPYVFPYNCPVNQYDCEYVPTEEISEQLSMLGSTVVSMTYDPASPDYMLTEIDFSGILDEFFTEFEQESPIIEMKVSLLLEEEASVSVPAVASDANQAAKDFAKFSLIMIAYDIMDEIEYDMMYGDDDWSMYFGTTVSLNDLGYEISPAFDADLSVITFSGFGEPSIELYWIDGTNVFTAPISLEELQPVVGNGSGAPDPVEYATYLAKVDPATFSLTKLFLIVIVTQTVEEVYYDSQMGSVYADALALENAAYLYCAQTTCAYDMQLTWGDLSPYVEGIDYEYYELDDSNTVVVERVGGYFYVHLEARGTGNYEFPNYITPSWGSEEDVIVDYD